MHNKYQVSISTGSKVMTQTLNLTFDLVEWPWHYNVTTQNMRLHALHLYTKNQMSISIVSKEMAKTKYLTLKNDLDRMMLPLKMCSLVRFTCTPNIKCLSIGSNVMANVTYIFDLWPWRMTLTMTYFPSKCAALWNTHSYQISSLYLYWLKSYGKC